MKRSSFFIAVFVFMLIWTHCVGCKTSDHPDKAQMPTIPRQPGGFMNPNAPLWKEAPRQSYPDDQGRMVDAEQFTVLEGLAGSKFAAKVLTVQTYREIDATRFKSERFKPSSLEAYISGQEIVNPYVFVVIEAEMKAVQGSPILKDAYYLDMLWLLDYVHRDHKANLAYRQVETGGAIRYAESANEYNVIRLAEGQSGRIELGYFIDQASLSSDKLYLTMGISVEDCQYLNLKPFLR